MFATATSTGNPTTLTTLIEQFIHAGLYLKNWSPNTVRGYQNAFRSLQAGLGETPITKASLGAWVVSLRQKGMSPGGANVYIRTVNSFLTWLAEEHEAPAHLKLLKTEQRVLETFSGAHVKAILAYRPKGKNAVRAWVLLHVLLDTLRSRRRIVGHGSTWWLGAPLGK